MSISTPLTCRNCGFVGTEAQPVETNSSGRPFCQDVVECWERIGQGQKGAAWAKQSGPKPPVTAAGS